MNLKPKWSVEFYRLSYTHQWRNGNQVGREITEPVMVGLTPLHQQWYPHSTSMITKYQQIQQVCSYFTCTMVVLLLCCCCCWWVAVVLLSCWVGLTGCANVDVCPHENNKWQEITLKKSSHIYDQLPWFPFSVKIDFLIIFIFQKWHFLHQWYSTFLPLFFFAIFSKLLLLNSTISTRSEVERKRSQNFGWFSF